MKRTFIFIAMAVLGIGLAGCTKNEDAPANSGAEGFTVMGTICDEGAETKVTYTDNASTAEFAWSNGDKISVVYNNGTDWKNSILTTTSTSKMGSFTTSEILTFADGVHSYYSHYPSTSGYLAPGEDMAASKIYFKLTQNSLSQYNMSNEIIEPYLLVAAQSADIKSGDKLSFSYKQVTSIIRIKFSTPQTVRLAHISCADPVFIKEGYVSYSTGEFTSVAVYTRDMYLTTPTGYKPSLDYIDFVVAPANLTGKKIVIEVTDWTGGTKYKVIDGVNIVRNNRYDVNFSDAVAKTDYIAGLSSCTLLAGKYWADVNAGYVDDNNAETQLLYGLLYQWGRKAGQGYDITHNTPSTGGEFSEGGNTYKWAQRTEPWTTITVSDQYFFYGVDSWIAPSYLDNSANKPLWDNTNGTAQNNPCPTGWRVPSLAELSALGNVTSGEWNSSFYKWVENFGERDNQKGIVCGTDQAFRVTSMDNLKEYGCIFLPAAGERTSTGLITEGNYRDAALYYWSYNRNASGSVYSKCIRGTTGTAPTSTFLQNSAGASVRCVKMM